MKNQKIRLYGINTPELTREDRAEGLIARDWVREKILNKNVVIRTHMDKKEKYGRWLAEVFIDDLAINEALVEQGMAVVYML